MENEVVYINARPEPSGDDGIERILDDLRLLFVNSRDVRVRRRLVIHCPYRGERNRRDAIAPPC
jgi:hypothetical protein